MNEEPTIQRYDADRTEEAVREFVEHLHDDLPPGPFSGHGDVADRFLNRRSEAEFNRMVAAGRAIVDAYTVRVANSSRTSS